MLRVPSSLIKISPKSGGRCSKTFPERKTSSRVLCSSFALSETFPKMKAPGLHWRRPAHSCCFCFLPVCLFSSGLSPSERTCTIFYFLWCFCVFFFFFFFLHCRLVLDNLDVQTCHSWENSNWSFNIGWITLVLSKMSNSSCFQRVKHDLHTVMSPADGGGSLPPAFTYTSH